MSKIEEKEVREKFQRVCVEEGRRLGLIFGEPEPGGEKISSVCIIGKDDDLDDSLIVTRDVGRCCVAAFELNGLQSSALNSGVNLRVFERICLKLAQSAEAIANGMMKLPELAKSLGRAESMLAKILFIRGDLLGVAGKVTQAALAA